MHINDVFLKQMRDIYATCEIKKKRNYTHLEYIFNAFET